MHDPSTLDVYDQEALEEFARRTGDEAEKALEKYGDIALKPEGHPDYDIFDYLINELVGMRRYGEMVANRAELMYKTGAIDKKMVRYLAEIATECHGVSIDLGVRLIKARQKMQRAGLMLGQPEKSYKKSEVKTYTPRKGIFPSS